MKCAMIRNHGWRHLEGVLKGFEQTVVINVFTCSHGLTCVRLCLFYWCHRWGSLRTMTPKEIIRAKSGFDWLDQAQVGA